MNGSRTSLCRVFFLCGMKQPQPRNRFLVYQPFHSLSFHSLSFSRIGDVEVEIHGTGECEQHPLCGPPRCDEVSSSGQLHDCL